MGYAKSNLFTGKYQPDEHGQIRIDGARWQVYATTQGPDGLITTPSGEEIEGDEGITLVLEDGQFWPVIHFLSVEEAERLYRQLMVLTTRVDLARKRRI